MESQHGDVFPWSIFRGTDDDLEDANDTLRAMAGELESDFESLLHSCVGHIFVM